MVLVGGEAGVGKSRLVGEAAAHARRHGARVLVGQCLDLEEGGLPYAPLVDMLRTLDRDLTPEEGSATLGPLRAFLGRSGEGGTPEGAAPGVAGPAGQARLFELLLTVIERLVASRPVVLVFEDLHWADRSTLDLVALIASSTRTLPVCTIGTYRSEDVPPRHPLRQLTAELTRRGARHLELGRLGAGDVAELLGALLGSPPAPELVASVVERSDGNPLFVEELAAGLADDPGAPMPPHLRDAVVSRVERMPVGAAAVLRTCAVGGREVEHDLLAEMVGAGGDTDPGALDRDLRTCVESGPPRRRPAARHVPVPPRAGARGGAGRRAPRRAAPAAPRLRHRARRAPALDARRGGRPVVVPARPPLGRGGGLRRRPRRGGAGRTRRRGSLRRARGPPIARVERPPLGPGGRSRGGRRVPPRRAAGRGRRRRQPLGTGRPGADPGRRGPGDPRRR